MIGWQLQAMERAGVREVAVVTGYLAPCLTGYGNRRFHNADWATTNMVSTLFTAGDWLQRGPTVISYADIVYESLAVQALSDSDADVAVAYHTGWRALWEARFTDPLSDAEAFRLDGNRIVKIGSKADSLDEIQGQYMGLLRVTPAGAQQLFSVWQSLPEAGRPRTDMTTLLSAAIEGGVPVHGVPFDGVFCEVDSESDLQLYEQKQWFPRTDASAAMGE